VELFFNRQGLPDWYITNKLPLRNREGAIVGLMGTTHNYENRKGVLRPFLHLERAVEYIRSHFREKISVEKLAQQIHLSPRQLHRKFVEAFGVGPQAFILKLRIQAACEALQDEQQLIADVATSVGFCDQSSMTQTFHRVLGITPRQYQMQFRLRRR
jgi:transcriptional regulator GlxA family with amidase domain